MSKAKTALKSFMVAVVVICVGGFIIVNRTIRSGMPDLDASVTHESLGADVTVIRDDWGVAHIEAESETDAYFAFGYTVAQDRLFQMEILRRLGRGELAEILGEPGLEMDKISRTLLWRRTAERLFQDEDKFDPEFLAILHAFVKGINHYIETNAAPIEFRVLGFDPEPFTVVDTLSLMGYMAYGFAEGIRSDALYSMVVERGLDASALFPGYSKGRSVTILEGIGTIFPPGEAEAPTTGAESASNGLIDLAAMLHDALPTIGAFYGSNSWVLSPDRSESGGAILANDPHIGFTNPGVWYECHIRYPGYESYGVHLPLVPFPVIAHNPDKAWAITMFENDDIDLYRETFDADDPSRVMYKGEWADVQEWTETILVKDAPAINHAIRVTPHGPVVTDMLEHYKGDPVSLWWLFHDVDHTNAEVFYRLANASNVDEARSAASGLIAPGLNISYADAKGNIAWWAAGRLPIHPEHVNSKTILDGASGLDEVLAYLPFSENPQLVNPPSGVIVTANNMPTSNAVGPIPTLEGYWQPVDRAWRITELLESRKTWDIDTLKAVQTDTKLQTGHLLRDAVVRAFSDSNETGQTYTSQLKGDAKLAHEALAAWDSDYTVDSIGATVHQFVWDATIRRILQDELGDDLLEQYLTLSEHHHFMSYVVKDSASPFWDDISTEEIESSSDIIRESFEIGVSTMVDRLGDDWRWGKAHTVSYPYLILGEVGALKRWWEIGPLPAAGHEESVAKMSWFDDDYATKAGASMRLLLDYGNYGSENGIQFVLPTGNSGHILDPHYDDQVELFLGGGYRSVYVGAKQLKALKEHEMRFSPAEAN